MKDTLVAGIGTARTVEVDGPRTIDFMGEDLRVYATPELVRDIEMTCRELLLAHLEEGEDSVGTRVEVDHTGATMMGMSVEISATLAALDGRLVTFEVTAHDGVEQVAKGRHTRFVVDVEKLRGRLRAKAEKAGG
jgi:predicted thioesterase